MERRAILIVLGLLLGTAVCSDSTAPTMVSVAGFYEATVFTVTEAGGTTDVLADGGAISLSLEADGTVAGRLFVPGGGEGGADFAADLAGTWTLNGTTVTLDHPADTFLRDMNFTVSGRQLAGQATFGEAAISVVFEKRSIEIQGAT